MPIDIFSKTPLSKSFPVEMQNTIDELKKSSDKEDCLKKAYQMLCEKYEGKRIKTYVKLWEIFGKDVEYFWKREGFLHCTNINYVMRTLLVKSGFFEEEDIRLRWIHIWYVSPHQYLQVNLGKRWVDVDIWANAYGIELGDHARGFH